MLSGNEINKEQFRSFRPRSEDRSDGRVDYNLVLPESETKKRFSFLLLFLPHRRGEPPHVDIIALCAWLESSLEE